MCFGVLMDTHTLPGISPGLQRASTFKTWFISVTLKQNTQLYKLVFFILWMQLGDYSKISCYQPPRRHEKVVVQAAEHFPSLPQKYLNLHDFSILRPSLGLLPKLPKNNQLKWKHFAKRGRVRTASVGRKIDVGVSMNPGSKGVGRWEKQRGVPAQLIMCRNPTGGCLCPVRGGISVRWHN